MARAVGGHVGVVRRDGQASFSGARPCGLRTCPNCGPQIQAVRRAEISDAVAAARSLGMQVGFLTLTMRHSSRDDLADLMDSQLVAWRALTSGGIWHRLKRRHGIKYLIRTVECAHGEKNGWHPHVHVLLFIDPAAALVQDWSDLFGALVLRWRTVVLATGHTATVQGQKLLDATDREIDQLAGYLTKEHGGDIAWELTASAATTKNRGELDSPADLLVRGLAGETRARALWNEYEEATKGRQLIGYSAGMRYELKLQPAATADESVAVELEPASRPVQVCRLSAGEWEEVSRRRGLRAEIVLLVEMGCDSAMLIEWLGNRGISASLPPDLPPERPPLVGALIAPEGGPPWLVRVEDL